MTRGIKAVRIVLALSFVAVAMAAPASATHSYPIKEVSIRGYQFVPDEITVPLGHSIRWTNNEDRNAILPPNKAHNLIAELYQAPGEDLPELADSRRVCDRFEAGQRCLLDPHKVNIAALLPRGKHTLTCTIDRDHAVLMHFTITVT